MLPASAGCSCTVLAVPRSARKVILHVDKLANVVVTYRLKSLADHALNLSTDEGFHAALLELGRAVLQLMLQ